jgi:UDP-N-acetylmuramate: L-alanyl-gamma-D-glutamyl-meso-diaminopimelate ligase
VVNALNAAGTNAALCPDVEAILKEVVPQLEAGDVVAILSNGGFDGIYEKLPARLRELQG